MPKINVYLPDELAEAVKEAALPVSAICQRALEQAVRRVTAIRQTGVGDLRSDDPRLSRFTPRTRMVFRLARERADAEGAPQIDTGHLLAGMLAEGQNLALHVLRAIEIEPALLEQDIAARAAAGRESRAGSAGQETADRESPSDEATGDEARGDEAAAGRVAAGTEPAGHGAADREAMGQETAGHEDAGRGAMGQEATGQGRRLDAAAANALELAVTEALALGHNYIGCEHLLLGLVAEPEGIGGQLLRARGAEPRLTRRAVAAALAGYVHLRAQSGGQEAASGAGQSPAAALKGVAETVAALVRRELRPIADRIERLEQRLGLDVGDERGDRESGTGENR